MADVERLLHKAVPRLRKGDPKAAKLRGRLTRLAASLWSKGPHRLQRLGTVVGDDDWEAVHPEGDPEAFLEQAHGVLGDKGFVRFVRAVKEELAARVARKKESAQNQPVVKPPKPKSEPEPDPKAMHFSDVKEIDDGSDELALPPDEELSIPDDSDMGLTLPPDEPMVEITPDVPEVEEFDLMAAEQPLQIRFDDDGGAKQDAEDRSASSAADRALARFRRAGDLDELKQALKLYKQAYKDADGPFPMGVARAGLAQAYLLAGDRAKAQENAKQALEKFPNEPTAISVLCRVVRKGEKVRLRTDAALRRVEAALIDKDLRRVRDAAKDLKKLRPDGPEGALAELAVATVMGRDNVEDLLQAAWERYPGPATDGDLPLGKAWEDPLIKGCVAYLMRQRDADEEASLTQAVQDTGDKANLIAGAIEIALGTIRRALATRERVSKPEQQELLLQLGRALYFAQHYDASKEVLAGARRIDRNGNHVLDINRLEQQCGVMRRAFDKPGAKAKRGKLDGLGLGHFREALGARLELVLTQRQKEAGGVEEEQQALIEAIVADPKRRARIEKKAQAADLDDPFARLGMVENQLAALDAASGEAEPEPESGGGGFFGKMKAGINKAAAKAKSAAKGAELALRRSMAAGKRKEALIAVGQALRDRPDRGWGDKELDAFLTRTDAVAARLECLDEEADAVRKLVGRAGDL
jgi:tetratricopeptide (TPR) repeat protein